MITINSEIFNDSIPNVEYFIYRSNTPDWKIELSQTDFIDITYVIGGHATYYIDGQEIVAKEGDLLCIPKNSLRSAESQSASLFECFATNFYMRFIDGEEVGLPLPLISNVGVHMDIIDQYKRLNEDWLRCGQGHIMRIRAHFMLILQRFFEMIIYDVDTHQFDPRVKAAIRFMTDHYSEPISLSSVAEAVKLSPIYFGTLFKRETNLFFKHYLIHIRLNQAEYMIKTGKGNITEIAQKCGFKDVFYFSKSFKKYKGFSPSTIKTK